MEARVRIMLGSSYASEIAAAGNSSRVQITGSNNEARSDKARQITGSKW